MRHSSELSEMRENPADELGTEGKLARSPSDALKRLKANGGSGPRPSSYYYRPIFYLATTNYLRGIICRIIDSY